MLKVSFVPFITSPILLVIIWAPGTLRSHTPQELFQLHGSGLKSIVMMTQLYIFISKVIVTRTPQAF